MTILQSLSHYYDRMVASERGMPPPGFSREKIAFCLVLSDAGKPKRVLKLADRVDAKQTLRRVIVPLGEPRTSGIKPHLLWDKTAYALGVTGGPAHRVDAEHDAFKAVNLALAGQHPDPGLRAFRNFLQTWTKHLFEKDEIFRPEMLDSNFVFALDGDTGFLHDRPAIRALLASQDVSDEPEQMCLVSGVRAPLARIHPTIKGVWGSQATGASLASYNCDAFTSFGKEQGANAPTSKLAAFRYGAALNHLLENESRNRLLHTVGGASVLFWADVNASLNENQALDAERLMASLMGPLDERGRDRWFGAARRVRSGRRSLLSMADIEPDTRVHVLGLRPNVGRLSVQFWIDQTLADFVNHMADHFGDTRIEPEPTSPAAASISRLIVRTIAPLGRPDSAPEGLAGEIMRAALTGDLYPRSWLTTALMRVRGGDNPAFGWHASAIRAFLRRSDPSYSPPVERDPAYLSPGYQLGRLFAVLEVAEYTAIGRMKFGIASRHFNAASCSPKRTFHALLRGAKIHIAQANMVKRGRAINGEIESIMSCLPKMLPNNLRVEEQGRFVIGYYHERCVYTSKPDAAHAPPGTDEYAC